MIRTCQNIIFSVLAWTLFLGCAAKSESISRNQSEALTKEASVEYDIAYEFFRTGEMVRALTAALKSNELSPKNADARNLLGLIYFRKGDVDLAKEAFLTAIKINPDLTEAYTNLGSLYYFNKDYKQAEATLLKALENPLYLNPERIYNNLGLTLAAQKRNKEAIEAFEQAIALRPEYYLPFQNLGKVLLEEKTYKRAEIMFAEAARLCSNCSEPRYHLGAVLLKQNKKDKAIQAFKRGFDVDPKGYYGQLCRQYLIEEK